MADTSSITYKLMQSVYKQPILYDTQHPEHNHREKKDEAWESIARELDLPATKAKTKWKNLRDSYIKFMRSLCTGSETAAKNYSKWQWSSEMEMFKPFLFNSEVYKPRRMRFFPLPDQDVSSEPDGSREALHAVSKREPDPLQFLEESEEGLQYHYAGEGGVQSSTDGCPPVKRRRTESEEDQGRAVSQEMDAVDHLMLAYAKTIKCFSLRRQAETKLQIAQLIMRQELEEIEERGARGAGSRV